MPTKETRKIDEIIEDIRIRDLGDPEFSKGYDYDEEWKAFIEERRKKEQEGEANKTPEEIKALIAEARKYSQKNKIPNKTS